MSGSAEKLKIQNFVNSIGNCVHYICTECLVLRINYIYPKFRKFNGKLCTLYMYEMSRFAKKLNILNYGNSTVNYVNYRYRMSGFADKLVSRTAKIQWEIVYNKCTDRLDLQIN